MIPGHLKQFIVEEDAHHYTAEDHAVWRFIMKQHVKHLAKNAHEVYLEGLERTGISVDHIPSISEMNVNLEKVGWQAVLIDGYIPSAAFMEFHSHHILPIAKDMRSIDHILYTPAPDIVHEAAGHAPFLIDVDYSEYLQKLGEYGLKALFNAKDVAIYEAIRELSILKEDAAATSKEIINTEQKLLALIDDLGTLSEASLLGRLHWWTVEYGLVGSVDDYKLFGAGLLSSLGESRSCLDDEKVKKIPYAVDADTVKFDITTTQPQLFVTKSCRHMRQVLEEFATNMCFRIGGANALKEAILCETVNTCEYSSGLQVSGRFVSVKTNSVNRETYLNTEGPTQLSYGGKELKGHGTDYHAPGFGSPIGGLQGIAKPLEDLSVDELERHGIVVGEHVELEFLSGITVKGVFKSILREDGKNLIFSFEDCVVTSWQGQVLFEPEWGTYDMAVGRRIVSVYAGAADREKFDTYPAKSERTVSPKVHTKEQKILFGLYQSVRDLRNSGDFDLDLLNQVCESLKDYPLNWLLRLEVWELCQDQPSGNDLAGELTKQLKKLENHSKDYKALIGMGLDQSL